MLKILVTGTDGYIGVLLAPYLLEKGFEVTGLDTGFYREGWLNSGVDRFPSWINKDIRQITVEDLREFDAVVHLAELSNDPLGQLNPSLTFQINHLGSVELAKNCKRAGVRRFIYTSSCSVYGVGTGDFKSEQSEVNPLTAYAECKVLVERDVAQLADDGFSPTFLRNATAYGPSPRMRFDIVLNNLAGLAWTTGEIKMTSDGTPWRPVVHVLDICEAIACTLSAPPEIVHNQIFNVGSTEENYQIRDLAEIVTRAFPGCKVTFGPSGGDNRSYRVSCDKIGEALPGYKCKRTAMMGAMELHELFERIGMTSDHFKFRAFTRLHQIKHLLQTNQIDEELFWV